MTLLAHRHVVGGEDPRVAFYADALDLLAASDIPFLVGGTFAFARYTEIHRETKDLDIFVRRSDCTRTLRVFDDCWIPNGADIPPLAREGATRRGFHGCGVRFGQRHRGGRR